MIATAFDRHQLATPAPLQRLHEDALASAFLPEACPRALSDHALAVLARTAANWFSPSLANRLHVSAQRGRIRLAGHVCTIRPLACLKTVLLGLPGVGGLDTAITVDPVINPPQAYSVDLRHRQAG